MTRYISIEVGNRRQTIINDTKTTETDTKTEIMAIEASMGQITTKTNILLD